MYIKINGEETRYNDSLEPFTTQHGYEAVRFKGDDIPETDKGFKVYGDDDTEIFDLSRYTHPYGKNEFCVEADSIEPIEPAEYKPLPPNPLDVKLANMNRRISAITPYEQTKTAYFGEVEKVFYGVPQGNTTVFFDKYEGAYEISRIEDRLTVSFPERLQDMTNITIMVQQ
jgi:hypothetical protein